MWISFMALKKKIIQEAKSYFHTFAMWALSELFFMIGGQFLVKF